MSYRKLHRSHEERERQTVIYDEEMKLVNTFKYLAQSSKRYFSINIQAVDKKAQQRVFLWNPMFFSISQKLLHLFYASHIESYCLSRLFVFTTVYQ